VSYAVQQWLFFAFAATWFGGAIVLYLRYLRKRGIYLRRFPPVASVPLDTYKYLENNPFSPQGRAAFRAIWQPQDDPKLESLRGKVWRGYGYVVLWGFGFPILVVGVVILLLLLWHPPK
jgi:hypothetical protein